MGLVFGVVILVTALLATLGTQRWRAAPHGRDAQPGSLGPRSFVAGAVEALRYPAFRMLFASFSLIYLGSVISVTLFIHYQTYFVQIVDSTQVSLVRSSFYIGLLVGMPLWVGIAPAFEKRPLYVASSFVTAAIMAFGFVLVGPGRLFGTGDFRPIALGQALAGVFFSLFFIVPASMLADISDEDAAATGHERQGVFFGIANFGQKLATGLSALLAGVLIDDFAGLIPGEAIQSASTVERIGVLSCLLPAALLLVGGLLMLRYPLNRQRVQVAQASIQRAQEEAAAIG